MNASRKPADASTPTIGNEASYLGFESATSAAGNMAEDYWNNATTTGRNELVATAAHTGKYAWQVGPRPTNDFTYGPGRTFRPERQVLRYKLSAWVKSSTGYVANDARLVLSINHNPTVMGGAYLNVSSAYASTAVDKADGQWHYYEVIIDLQAAHNQTGIATTSEQFQVVAYTYNGGNGSCILDDLRFQPIDAQATTYTYDSATGQPTSIAGPDSRPVQYEYDDLQRLITIKDFNGNIVKASTYHYAQ